jgi:hypothetical protein
VLTSNTLEGASFSGASQLTAHQLTGSKFYLETTGASKATLDGAVDELIANITGAGDLRAESLQTKDCPSFRHRCGRRAHGGER